MDALFGGPVAANDNFRKCLVCENEVTGHAARKYCGEACARAMDRTKRNPAREKEMALARSPERICELCGTSFRKVKKDKAEPRFCSKRCSGTAIMANLGHVALVTNPVSFIVLRKRCRCCDSVFTAHKKSFVFCSDECRKDDARDKARKYASANDNRTILPRRVKNAGTCSPLHTVT